MLHCMSLRLIRVFGFAGSFGFVCFPLLSLVFVVFFFFFCLLICVDVCFLLLVVWCLVGCGLEF